jgi:membrane protein involved in colicin uptake
MEVIATAKGYYGSLRKVGDKFEVKDGATASWFKPTDEAKAKADAEAKAKADAEAKAKADAEAAKNKAPGKGANKGDDLV